MSETSPGKSAGVKTEGKRKRRIKIEQAHPRTEKFTGRTESLEDAIYDIGISNQSDLFMQTTKKLANYAGRKLRKLQDIKLRIETVRDIPIRRPSLVPTEIKDAEKPSTQETELLTTNRLIFSREIDTYVKRVDEYRQNKSTMYSKILGQCTEPLITKLEAMDEYEDINNASDAIQLLQAIRQIAFEYESQKYPFINMHLALKQYYRAYQKKYVTEAAYLENFSNNEDVIKQIGGEICCHPSLINYVLLENSPPIDPSSASPDQIQKAKKEAEDRYSAAGYLCGLNRGKYENMVDNLANTFLSGRDIYLKSKVQAHKLVTGWNGAGHSTSKDRSDGINFATIDEEEEEEEARIYTNAGKILTKKGEHVVCFKCGKNHWRSDCIVYKAKLKKKKEEETSLEENANVTIGTTDDEWGDDVDYSGLMFAQPSATMKDEDDEEIDYNHILEQSKGEVDKLWVLLDNQSTVNVFLMDDSYKTYAP
mmetsp:Transcript_42989/g.50291  ORF Transcript_42989/g.50291 Transcript_42989/m.50291 type:complete len:480 (-) Transcript_42989:318-1757(-)|eukprot:CAMPEP_0194422536 /NCGR_PEP_ID=MMETSP0176-20130528/21832_1 /TAXON_ID=216777 /ORGANISM="Proboscia alata, Strain PI-D3" /LENGTH=479 /DNA_ID=CAMNT_0039231311 /DNA_START=133 /DNA_END=1572 /DNA_ORIENTATION=+